MFVANVPCIIWLQLPAKGPATFSFLPKLPYPMSAKKMFYLFFNFFRVEQIKQMTLVFFRMEQINQMTLVFFPVLSPLIAYI